MSYEEKRMKNKFLAVIVSIFSIGVLFAGGAAALGQTEYNNQDKDANLEKAKVVDGAYYSTGQTVTIAGTVKGDVYCAGRDIVVSGTIEGDVLCAGQNVRISGTVNGDVRVAAQAVTIDGIIQKSVSIMTEKIDITKSAKIGQDLNGLARVGTIDGNVQRDIALNIETLTIVGSVGRNLQAQVDNLTVSDGASIAGLVDYRGKSEASIAEGTIKGEMKYTKLTDEDINRQSTSAAISMILYLLLAFLIMSLVLILVAPRTINAVAATGQKRLGTSIAAGVALIFAVPLVGVLVGITIVGIPLAIFIALGWTVICLLAGPVFAYYLGRVILRGRTKNVVARMFVGVAVLVVLFCIPILNIITWIAVLVAGTGMIGLHLFSHQKKPTYSIE